MKNILFISWLLLLSCRSSPEVSFKNLTNAYISWYFRYHPIESTRYNMKENHGKFKVYEISGRNEYYADISRFLIELSQIDITKLNADERIDYKILYSNLKRMEYIMENHRPWEWNPIWTLEDIHDGMYLLSERSSFEMDLLVESVQSRLKEIPKILGQSKDLVIGYSPIHISYANIRINKLVNLLNGLPLKLNSDHISLDEIDLLIKQSMKALQSYKQWLNSEVVKLEKLNFPMNLHLLESGFQHFVGPKYVPNAVYGLAKKKLIFTQDRLFHLALPIYLIENDEPVWLDRADTLEVIRWSIQNINEETDNQVGKNQVLSQFYDSIIRLEKFIYNKSLIVQKKSKDLQLEYAPEYNQSISPNYLFEHLPKYGDMDIKLNIDPPKEGLGKYTLLRQEIDIINAKYIVPGYIVQLTYAQSNPSMIRYLFQDPVTVAGWQAYSVKMSIDEGFGNWNNEYHILKLREELSVIVSAIIEYRYYTGEFSRLDSKNYLQKMAFIDEIDSEVVLIDSDCNYFSGTQSFVGLMEMNSLLTEYKRTKGDAFNLSEFHSFVLSDGIIPFYELKKKVIYP